MVVGEWVALGTFAIAVLGALAHMVWLLSGIKTKLDMVIDRQQAAEKQLATTSGQIHAHLVECAQDKSRTGQKLDDHERRLSTLEARPAD